MFEDLGEKKVEGRFMFMFQFFGEGILCSVHLWENFVL